MSILVVCLNRSKHPYFSVVRLGGPIRITMVIRIGIYTTGELSFVSFFLTKECCMNNLSVYRANKK